MPDKPIVLFDIDFTLINTARLKKLLEAKLAKNIGVRVTAVDRARAAYAKTLEKSTDFHPGDYIKHLCRFFRIRPAPLQKIYFQSPRLCQKALFPETLKTVKKIKKRCRLGIYTEGFRQFQLTKLKQAGLIPHFDKRLIFVHRRKISAAIINRFPPGTYIVDDNPEVIGELLKFPHITPIWLNRKGKKRHPSAATVHHLKEIGKILPNAGKRGEKPARGKRSRPDKSG